jgi:hypothetical protein
MSTYSQLRKIIPDDQALANKALQAALEQVKTIFNSSLPALTTAVTPLESNVGLDLINALTTPIPANVLAYFTDNFATGTGPNGLLLLADVVGTPAGWVHNAALSNTTSTLNTMTSNGAFTTLTDSSTGVYTIMENAINGDYTTETNPGIQWTTTIPVGKPGAGSYVGNSASASIQESFTSGLTPAMQSAVANIVAANPTSVAQTNTNWNDISAQIVREDTNLAKATVVFADLVAGTPPMSLVTSLPQYGLDTTEGGASYIMESVANVNAIGGQAIISTMRQARNQERLSGAGIQTDIIVSSELAEPQADLGTSQYTVAQATSQKII